MKKCQQTLMGVIYFGTVTLIGEHIWFSNLIGSFEMDKEYDICDVLISSLMPPVFSVMFMIFIIYLNGLHDAGLTTYILAIK